jgi:hypothetical protein
MDFKTRILHSATLLGSGTLASGKKPARRKHLSRPDGIRRRINPVFFPPK